MEALKLEIEALRLLFFKALLLLFFFSPYSSRLYSSLFAAIVCSTIAALRMLFPKALLLLFFWRHYS